MATLLAGTRNEKNVIRICMALYKISSKKMDLKKWQVGNIYNTIVVTDLIESPAVDVLQ